MVRVTNNNSALEFLKKYRFNKNSHLKLGLPRAHQTHHDCAYTRHQKSGTKQFCFQIFLHVCTCDVRDQERDGHHTRQRNERLLSNDKYEKKPILTIKLKHACCCV